MFSYFPKLYEDELFYSIIGRYHEMSGNINLKETINDVFGNHNGVAAIEFPCNLEYLSIKISLNYDCTSDYLINKTTLFPYYAPFLPEPRKAEIISELKNNNGKAIKYKLGFIAGGVCKKSDLHYCPICAKDEFRLYGEAFFHRFAQVQGSIICNKHRCILVSFGTRCNRSRLAYSVLKKDEIEDQVYYLQDKDLEKRLLELGEDIEFILGFEYSLMNESLIYERYLGAMRERGYLTATGSISQIDLNRDFRLFYGDSLLNLLESNIEYNNEYNWLKKLTRKFRGVTHPIRHILFMRFLKGSAELFMNENTFSSSNPFGHGPWPCLNICCDNYKKRVITSCEVTADYKTREPVGTFRCKCGFIYSRKAKNDVYKIGRVKDFGVVWKDELLRLYKNESNPSIKKITNALNCDSKTVNKYLRELSLMFTNEKAAIIKEKHIDKKEICDDTYATRYRNDVDQFILDNPAVSRSKIHKELTKQYIWLYRNDRDWFDEHLPEKRVSRYQNNRVCWEDRDIELVNLIKEEHVKMLSLGKPIRITKGAIAKRIDRLELIEKWLNKLPKTRILLDEITETVEQFQIRRIDFVCKSLHENGDPLIKWRIIRQAGLKGEVPENVNERIEANIEYSSDSWSL